MTKQHVIYRTVALLAALLCIHSIGLLSEAQQAAKPAPVSLQPIFGADADKHWDVKTGAAALSKDGPLGKPMLVVDKAGLTIDSKGSQTGARTLRALVRLRADATTPNVAFDLYLARKDAKDPGLRFVLTTVNTVDYVSCLVQQNGKAFHDIGELAKSMDWSPEFNNGLTYYPRAYGMHDIRPGWPEDFRVRIEHDMAALPAVHDKWLDVRAELRPGEVRFWVDDRLVAVKSAANLVIDGLTHLAVSPGVQIADFSIMPLPATGRQAFTPIRLDGYANAIGLLGAAAVKLDSLIAANAPREKVVEGVPFVMPAVNAEGKDHIDIGRSLYRHANLEGYHQSMGPRYIGSARRDPARIQLRLLNGQYDSLYLLAAADEDKDEAPLISAMFFRPGAGFAETFEAEVPLATAKSTSVKPVPVTLTDGRTVNLWLVKMPLDPGRLSSFADMDIIEVELTKKVHQFRSYPDPFIYGWHQAGTPSSVHVYAATLGQVPVGLEFQPDKFGHVWTTPAVPGYTTTLKNHTEAPVKGTLKVQTRSYDGTESSSHEQPVTLAKGETQKVKTAIPVKLNGYHDVVATLDIPSAAPNAPAMHWTEKRSLVRLAPDTRAPKWTEGKGALFGYWSYGGGHHTPKGTHHIELMTAAGARAGMAHVDHELVRKHWARAQAGAWEVSPQPWAREEKYDPKKYEEYQKEVIKVFTEWRNRVPPEARPDHVYFFPEPHVSTRLTEGNYPTYWNAPEYVLTPEEKANLRMFMVTSRCAAEAIRKQFPELKILIPWGDALFAVPILRAGFPKNLIDGSGIDTPGFERLPEMQLHQISVHRLYELRKEYEKFGLSQPQLQYCEGIFVPTEPGSCTWREQMDLYNRWAIISMAYGVKRFYSGWFAFDCGNYYGSEHYGGCGIQRRIPYCDPKPAYAAYATMTDRLDQANFDGWLKTGSLTNFCLRFKGPKGNVYTLWNIRGKRPVTLTLAADGDVPVIDAMNNTRVLKSQNKQVTVTTDPSVLYITGPEVTGAAVGESDHSEVTLVKETRQIADLADGSWKYSNQRDKIYENGSFAMQRFPGKFLANVVEDARHGKVLESKLGKQDTVHELMPWYNILTPAKPIVLDGAPSHLGVWVKGASDWGRVIYTLRDAKGERWQSIGTQDQYNCDDVHSWSAFNFDGWRYLRFEVPGHTGFDSFRKHGTTWWRSDAPEAAADGIVDLPLTLENIIVEQRSHILYVNDVQPAPSDSVCLGKLFAEYATPEDARPDAVALSKKRLELPRGVPDLPNPIVKLQAEGVGAPTAIVKLEPPIERNDGTLVHVHFQETAGAKNHYVWVSAHADGRGAVNMTPGGAKSGALVRELRPAFKFYFWVTYMDAKDKMSKPSAVATATLVDMFKEK